MPLRTGWRLWFLALGLATGAIACKDEPARTYPLRGQVISTTAAPDGRRDVTVKHEDIPQFMPAMTMGYHVRPPGQLDGFAAGDLITADLVVNARTGDTFVTNLHKTGHSALPADAKAVKVMDVMNPGDEVPDDELVDQTGATRKLSDWRGRALAVTFVYTRCPVPDFCPLMDRQFAALQRAIAADSRLRERTHLVSISFDPGHDSPSVIQAHAKIRGADPQTWSYLTGSASAIDRLTSRFGVSPIAEGDAAATLTHNLRTAVIDPTGHLVKIISGNEWTADALLADLREASGR